MSAQGMEIKAHRILLPHTHSQRHRVGGGGMTSTIKKKKGSFASFGSSCC